MHALSRREWLGALPALAAVPMLGRMRATPLYTSGIHHVTLAVTDVDRSVDFYQALFGAPVQARQGADVLLRIGDGPKYLAITEAATGGPRVDRYGLGVPGFDVDWAVDALAELGVREATGSAQGSSVGPGRMRVRERDETRELFVGDPNGLVIQLQDDRSCGGSGTNGGDCGSAEPAPTRGDLRLLGMSHLTIRVPDPVATNEFFMETFGMDIQAYQAASPLMGAGPGHHFLMFIPSGGNVTQIHHACFDIADFDVARVQAALERHGIEPRGDRIGNPPMSHWVSMRMPNRGGAPDGTPELYFADPDGIAIQLQDASYCGGGGYLGDIC